MPLAESLAEAKRVMIFCNACRYCEGFCAVFRFAALIRNAMEQSREEN